MAVLSHLAKQKTSFLTAEQKTDDSAGDSAPKKGICRAKESFRSRSSDTEQTSAEHQACLNALPRCSLFFVIKISSK